MLKRISHSCFFGIGLLGLVAFAILENPSPAKTPAEELATFQLVPGLKIELVASEPMVQDPVVLNFDEDGRLWVVEMRGFMPDIEGKGEKEPVGRISVLEDTNGDGKMDKSTIYLDSLVMPRALALVPGGALVVENQALWLTQDLNNDLKADSKTLIDKNYAGSALPEHSGNGLWRGLDNWYYNAKSRLRYRLNQGKWERDSTEFRGQWGISHDDEGRLFYNYNWSQLHADLVPPNYLTRNKHHTPTTGIDHGLTIDRRIYPIRSNPAVNRGYIPGTLDKEGKLLEFTAACSPLVYRGTALPQAFYGNAFVCEPSGNLIKRNVVADKGIILSAHDPHPGQEFLASSDERFRPVHLTSGPDGALYVADMYRGLIQHGAYITPYLREQTITRNLVLPVNRGRIWRITSLKSLPIKPKKLSRATSSELVDYLTSSNGWYRDMAQRLLVERNDKNATKAVTAAALKSNNSYGRAQALWVLAGLKQSNPVVLLALVSDQDPFVRATALRLLEPWAKADKEIQVKLEQQLLDTWEKAPPEQALQIALSANCLRPQASYQLLAGITQKYNHVPVMRDAVMSSLQNQEFAFLQKLWKLPSWQVPSPGKEIFLEMITAAIVQKRDATELNSLLTLLQPAENNPNEPLGWKEKAVLTGIAIKGQNSKLAPIQLPAAPPILTKSSGKLDKEKLNTLTSLFAWPGHTAVPATTQKKSVLSPEDQKLFTSGRPLYLSTCSGCHGTDGAGLSRFGPPLINSEWVVGDEKRLALIILHGLEGPVEVGGKRYNTPEILPVMPSHSTLDDASITAILTYIRNEWGNNAGPVNRRTVSTTRLTSQGRVMPWKSQELNEYILKGQAATENK